MSDQTKYQYDVFISYSHQDGIWVQEQLLPRLESAGLRVCIDVRDFEIGVPSLVNMERAVDNSEHTLLVLTPAWVASKWTEFESLLVGTSDPAGRRRKIIPLMLKHCEPPSRIAMLTWADFRDIQQHESQFNRLINQLRKISDASTPVNIDFPSILSEQSNQMTKMSPNIVGNFELPYGAVPPISSFYIERQADRECQDYFNPGKPVTIYVQAPRQMGKSSLMQRILYISKQTNNFEVAYVDCEKFTVEQLHSLDEFLSEFCYMISDTLKIPEAVDNYWSSARRSSLSKCSNYIAQYIIPKLNKPLILALDEVERVLDSPFRNDFFGMLRSWHNDRAHHGSNMVKVNLFLSSSTEPQLFIDNPNQSPFNVAQPVALHDFTLTQVQELNQQHGAPLTQIQLIELMKLLDGHPFLTRLALYLVATHKYDFVTLQRTANDEDGPFVVHLDTLWQKVARLSEPRRALAQICRHQTYPDDQIYYRLKGAGLVRRVGDKVVMRNQLYERYFAGRLHV